MNQDLHCGINTFTLMDLYTSFYHKCVESNVQLICLLVQTVEDNYK